MFDFSKVEAPKETKYLSPGVYTLHPTAVELGESTQKKTPYLDITFTGNAGMVKQKFYLSEKALQNLQYLHEGLFGKGITKSFDSNAQVHAYFEKVLTTKLVEKQFLVGGQEADNGRVYAELPFGRFFVREDAGIPEGEFEKDSARWNDVVKKRDAGKSVDLATDSSLLPSDGADSSVAADDDLPW